MQPKHDSLRFFLYQAKFVKMHDYDLRIFYHFDKTFLLYCSENKQGPIQHIRCFGHDFSARNLAIGVFVGFVLTVIVVLLSVFVNPTNNSEKGKNI